MCGNGGVEVYGGCAARGISGALRMWCDGCLRDTVGMAEDKLDSKAKCGYISRLRFSSRGRGSPTVSRDRTMTASRLLINS